jgi:hypothetical protein
MFDGDAEHPQRLLDISEALPVIARRSMGAGPQSSGTTTLG